MTPKVRKTLDIALRFSIAVLALSYLFYRIYSLPPKQIEVFFKLVLNNENFQLLFITLIILMSINWGLESFKWKLLISQSETISFGNAFKAILGGLAVSVFTPNRIGEFVGRVFILEKTDPLKGILLTIVGSFSQLIVTIALGTAAFVVFAPRYITFLQFDNSWLVTGFSISLVLISLLLIFIYFNISFLNRISILLPAKYEKQIQNGIDAIARCPKRLLFLVFLLSTLRYIVFSTQFYLAITFVGLNFSFLHCMMVIPMIYLLLVVIPTIALTEIGVRGSVSVFLFGLLTAGQTLNAADSLAIISASTFIWLLNIAIPSLAGVLVVFRLNFFSR